jgi:hypothetical protein
MYGDIRNLNSFTSAHRLRQAICCFVTKKLAKRFADCSYIFGSTYSKSSKLTGLPELWADTTFLNNLVERMGLGGGGNECI